MPNPVCVKCKLFFKPKRNNVYWEEGMPVTIPCPNLGTDGHNHPADPCSVCKGTGKVSEWRSYKLWNSDLLQCKGCETEIIWGHGRCEVSEHHQEGYQQWVESVQDRYYGRVDDC